MKRIILKSTIALFVLLFISSCQLFKKNTPAENYFSGTIAYDVVVSPIDEQTEELRSKKDLLGTKMQLTIYPNGDIQRVYSGNTNVGYDAEYIQLDNNIVLEKFKSSDSISSRDAGTENMTKISDIRISSDEPVTVLSMRCKSTAVGVQEISQIDKKRLYATVYYYYNASIKLDKTKYMNVNEDMWAYFMTKSDGAIFLKYEVVYATHKVSYTATKVAKGEYPSQAENLIDLSLPDK